MSNHDDFWNSGTGAGVFAYGCPPEPAAPPRVVPPLPTGAEQWPTVPFIAFGPCPKCKRHCRENECPFCYADALKPEALSARVAELTRLVDEANAARDVAERKLDGLRRDLAKLLADHGGAP